MLLLRDVIPSLFVDLMSLATEPKTTAATPLL